jgi:hypothetical protein
MLTMMWRVNLDEEVAVGDEAAAARGAVGDYVGHVDAVPVLVQEVDACGDGPESAAAAAER